MPWSTTPVFELRLAFGHAVRTAGRSVVAAARDFHISRKTAYKWLARFDAQESLDDRSRQPHHSPERTAAHLEEAVLAVRDQHGWGPRKIVAYLRNHHRPAPPIRTAAAILRRHHRIAPPTDPEPTTTQRFEHPAPNQLWQMDFKGPVEVARQKVYPLTVLDDHSRFLLALRCGPDVTHARVWDVLWELFGEYGLPDAILCDNAFAGSPGLGWLEARLLRLGITTRHGRPYHPQTQGKVERLHATLEAEVFPRLDRDDPDAFAAGLDRWRRDVYNCLRPHEALGDLPPVARWRPSTRPRPDELPTITYPPGAVLRLVGAGGEIRWHSAKLVAGHGLIGEYVRVEETDRTVELWYGTYRIREIPVDQLGRRGLL